MATVEKKTHNIAKFYRGELFDLTVTSANNKFGKEKIVHSLKNGINFKIEYFIKELDKITSDKHDDKSKKRKIRKEFLELCKSNKILEHLFNLLINYLNGGQTLTMTNEYNNQSLIVVLMGGNIINIYFNIIYFIKFQRNIDITINYISKIFNDITYFTKEVYEVLHLLKQFYNTHPEFITKIELFKDTGYFNSYSDLDFALLPNILYKTKVDGGGSKEKRKLSDKYNPHHTSETSDASDASDMLDVPDTFKPKKTKKTKKTKSAKAKLKKAKSEKSRTKAKSTKKAKSAKSEKANKSIEELKYENGFLLYRIKSNFSILDTTVDSDSAQKITFFKNVKIENDIINGSYRSKQVDCDTNDMKNLGIVTRKELIAHLAQKDWVTKEGLSKACKSFIENLLAKKERTRLCTNKNTEIICNNGDDNESITDVDKLKNLITYIRKITKNINIHLTQKGLISQVNKIFDDLHTIMDPKNNLINICNSIVKEFYELQATQEVIVNINKFYKKTANATSNNFSISTFNITNYLSIERNIKHLETLLISNIKSGIKSGIILTVNLISGNNNDKVIYLQYDNENNYFDDLEKK